MRVTQQGQVSDVASNNNAGPLEFPASPAFAGTTLYASNFDQPRGANAPNDPGVGASIAAMDVGIAGAPVPFPGVTSLPGTGAATNIGMVMLVAVVALTAGVALRRRNARLVV